jgi:hypothetical protein
MLLLPLLLHYLAVFTTKMSSGPWHDLDEVFVRPLSFQVKDYFFPYKSLGRCWSWIVG